MIYGILIVLFFVCFLGYLAYSEVKRLSVEVDRLSSKSYPIEKQIERLPLSYASLVDIQKHEHKIQHLYELFADLRASIDSMEPKLRACEDNVDELLFGNKKKEIYFTTEAMEVFPRMVEKVKEVVDEMRITLEKFSVDYVHKDNLCFEMEKYYDEVAERVKADKEEVWKRREKAFSIPNSQFGGIR